MNYHNIVHDDMRNGEGLRVTLFVSGCNHYCLECQNPQTWDVNSGIKFDEDTKQEIFDQLNKDYIDGITLSGGDPLYKSNLPEILSLLVEIKSKFPNKTIWIYTGYTWEEIFNEEAEFKNAYDMLKKSIAIEEHRVLKNGEFNYQYSNFELRQRIINLADVLVDGVFKKDLADVHYHWAGSTNQRIIDVQKSLKTNQIVLKEI